MQNITPPPDGRAPVIQSYGPAGFRISGGDYATSLLVTPDSVTAISAQIIEEITFELLAPLAANQPPLEVILVGTGEKHLLLPPLLRTQLKSAGISVDAMATGAACRTFNILISEERRVAALLLLPVMAQRR
jgi:uncharacterized protein